MLSFSLELVPNGDNDVEDDAREFLLLLLLPMVDVFAVVVVLLPKLKDGVDCDEGLLRFVDG